VDFAGIGEWLKNEGPESDIVICTRARMARNVDGFSFSPTLDEVEAKELNRFLREKIEEAKLEQPLTYSDLAEMSEIERLVLVERHLISREHSAAAKPRAVAVSSGEDLCLMINEEDHLRMQVFRSGFRLDDAYQELDRIDEALSQKIRFAFSEDFGYLTACPTNAGTGLRISAMVHLPGMVMSKQIEKAHAAVQKLHLAVRGLYGEGSKATGDFYQISNQVTLGRTEEDLRQNVATAVLKVVAWERDIRQELFDRSRILVEDRVMRALGVLERARTLSSEEAIDNLSQVRMGIHLMVIKDLPIAKLNQLLLISQPGHLQRLEGRVLEPAERDELRAKRVRETLGVA
jgi:protein arginine kinase